MFDAEGNTAKECLVSRLQQGQAPAHTIIRMLILGVHLYNSRLGTLFKEIVRRSLRW